jgi:hypothetical protein
MIKRGDKVVCIKNFETIYEVGKIYKVDCINSYNYVYIAEENHFGRYGFYIEESITLYFNQYFILLSEYRENQIKSVLDV